VTLLQTWRLIAQVLETRPHPSVYQRSFTSARFGKQHDEAIDNHFREKSLCFALATEEDIAILNFVVVEKSIRVSLHKSSLLIKSTYNSRTTLSNTYAQFLGKLVGKLVNIKIEYFYSSLFPIVF